MKYLPISLNLERGPCLVVGGGAIALQKVRVLVAAGAEVKVVAPAVLQSIAQAEGVEVIRREFEERDLDGVLVVISATDQKELNHRVRALAKQRGLLVNVVDDPAQCDFIFPSILRRGEMTLAVSTGGASPALARLTRETLEAEFCDEFEQVLLKVGEVRRTARKRLACQGARRAVNELAAVTALKMRGAARPELFQHILDLIDALEAVDAGARRGMRKNPWMLPSAA